MEVKEINNLSTQHTIRDIAERTIKDQAVAHRFETCIALPAASAGQKAECRARIQQVDEVRASSVEQVLEKSASPRRIGATTPGMLVIASMPLLLRRRCGCGSLLGRCISGIALTALDDFVEFSTVKPDPPALRAIVDLDPLTLGHDKSGFYADWAFHDSSP